MALIFNSWRTNGETPLLPWIECWLGTASASDASEREYHNRRRAVSPCAVLFLSVEASNFMMEIDTHLLIAGRLAECARGVAILLCMSSAFCGGAMGCVSQSQSRRCLCSTFFCVFVLGTIAVSFSFRPLQVVLVADVAIAIAQHYLLGRASASYNICAIVIHCSLASSPIEGERHQGPEDETLTWVAITGWVACLTIHWMFSLLSRAARSPSVAPAVPNDVEEATGTRTDSNSINGVLPTIVGAVAVQESRLDNAATFDQQISASAASTVESASVGDEAAHYAIPCLSPGPSGEVLVEYRHARDTEISSDAISGWTYMFTSESSLEFSMPDLADQWTQTDLSWNGRMLVCRACVLPPKLPSSFNGRWHMCPMRQDAPSWLRLILISGDEYLDADGRPGFLMQDGEGVHLAGGRISLLDNGMLQRESKSSGVTCSFVNVHPLLRQLDPEDMQLGRATTEADVTCHGNGEMATQTLTATAFFCNCRRAMFSLCDGTWNLYKTSSGTELTSRNARSLKISGTTVIDSNRTRFDCLLVGERLLCDKGRFQRQSDELVFVACAPSGSEYKAYYRSADATREDDSPSHDNVDRDNDASGSFDHSGGGSSEDCIAQGRVLCGPCLGSAHLSMPITPNAE